MAKKSKQQPTSLGPSLFDLPVQPQLPQETAEAEVLTSTSRPDACPQCGGRSAKAARPGDHQGNTHYCLETCAAQNDGEGFYFTPVLPVVPSKAIEEIQLAPSSIEADLNIPIVPEAEYIPPVIYQAAEIGKDVVMLSASATNIPLENGSVQCIVTSPPYWALRKYAGEQGVIWGGAKDCEHEWNAEITKKVGKVNAETSPKQASVRGCDDFTGEAAICRKCGAWMGAYGLEPSVDMYISHSVQILRECRRVLRSDGVLFWNLGDSYAGGGTIGRNDVDRKYGAGKAEEARTFFAGAGIKPKDLCLIPQRIALAAQADGWWIRSIIIWSKLNPMPESCTDRPTDAYEHIIMMTKSEEYFWDADAVREKTGNEASEEEYEATKENAEWPVGGLEAGKSRYPTGYSGKSMTHPAGRNVRNVWTFPTQPYSDAHFATFPEELPRRCILAATSAKGACAKCGAPWRRIVLVNEGKIGKDWTNKSVAAEQGKRMTKEQQKAMKEREYKRETLGWERSCNCVTEEIKPCVVLDPFGGSGTTGRVAIELNRRAVLVDITYKGKEGYHTLAEKRTSGVQRVLPIYHP